MTADIGDKPLPEPMMTQFIDAYINDMVSSKHNSG